MSNRDKALALRFQGLTYREIGERLGISRQRVQQLTSPPPAVRDRVVAAAGGLCQECGANVGKSGHVHHKGGDGDDYNDEANLVLLCLGCHMTAHGGSPQRDLSEDERQKVGERSRAWFSDPANHERWMNSLKNR